MRHRSVGPLVAATAATSAAALVAAVLAQPPASGAGAGVEAASSAHGVIRVNQQGYLPGEPKQGRLMSDAAVRGARYRVRNASGRVVLSGPVPAHSTGAWNAAYPAVYRLDLSALHAPGRYRVTTTGGVSARSPWFRVRSAGSIFGTLLDAGVLFDRNQRDGADVVPGPLHRRPSHLLDRHAFLYRWPHMEHGSDLITDRRLHRIGGPVNVEGGWFDAGDYLKFTHSAAYADVLLYTSARMLGRRTPPALLTEARFGLRWLSKMWRPRSRTLLVQVGIGSGNRAGTFRGDHDGWRLPQADDRDTRHVDRFVSHRPVFLAAAPGHRISPNLVGRTSAAFALAAQHDAGGNPARARHELHLATTLYARAALKHRPRPLVTALPHAFYPESTWRDDMQLGAAEIALAAHALGRPAQRYLRDSARFAHAFIGHGSTGDTLNLYDTGALADASLADAMRTVRHGRLAVTRHDLVGDLSAQIQRGIAHARQDPLGAAEPVDEFDANSHTFALVATVGLYDELTHSRRYAGFASLERTWLLGGDPWGVSAMVGVGHRFPRCMQHQVANLSGTLDGTPPLDVGAVVNGPNGQDNFQGGLGGFQDGMRHCAASHALKKFDGQNSRYVDDVRSWQTDEPALDMTGAAIIAAAAQLRIHQHARVPAHLPAARDGAR
ncbi:MAG TPA: glycoside hydrolase family 9 protein [Nocardioides sp.]|uniref:glycoside hydrolase family 9 protein n=1 Tax=Nocardioides sp. TaxID=35761 RepID=UPI002E338283|nr:glycoside hydrolase family 9 protein [Nocardioides sp.]HEX3929910.1 glycoside hydrolase family 9 protein [Nocardioides sp.]